MIRTLYLLTLGALALSFTGCDKLGINLGGTGGNTATQSQPNGFAIIDLDQIASRLKKDVQLQNALKQRESQFNNELSQLRNRFRQQVELQQQQLGTEPTQEQQQQLAQLVNNLNVQLSRAQSTAQQQLNRDEITLVQNFRNEVRPVAVKIALERGFSIVLTKNEAVLFAYDDNYDITEEVIRRMAAPGSGLTPLVP
tara:strand:- start:9799 stop:10389 length:591 start_codon:yes stop_codon:yes gene_type:complete